MKITWDMFFRDLIPLISAQFFFVFLVYFTLVRKRIAKIYPYYAAFLVAFIVFLGGGFVRMLPIEIHTGYHLYFRMFFLFTVGIPSLLIASAIQSGRRTSLGWQVFAYCSGFVWILLYVVARDSATYMQIAPIFGIEVAQIESWGIELSLAHHVQLGGTFLLLVFPCLYFLIRRSPNSKPVFFLIGVLSFGLFMVIGTATTQWWIYYTGSIFSTFFFGRTVFLDVKDMRRRVDNIAPLIREELLQSIHLHEEDTFKLRELFEAVGMEQQPNRFLMLKPDVRSNEQGSVGSDFLVLKELIDSFFLDANWGGRYLMMPSGSLHIGVCVSGSKELSDERMVALAEELREHLDIHFFGTVCIGIGGFYEKLSELSQSYEEAFASVQHASLIGSNMVVKYTDLHSRDLTGSYPFHRREKLLQIVRSNSQGLIHQGVNELLSELFTFCSGNLTECKLRVRDVMMIFVDSGVALGGDSNQLFENMEESNHQIARSSTLEAIGVVLSESLSILAQQMAAVPETRVYDVVERAKLYLNHHFQENIGVDDVSDHLEVSRSYLMSMFKNETGTTINQYLTDTRIEKAKSLLLSQSITEVAFEVGFNTSSYFSTVFKKQTGMTPRSYQEESR